VDLVLRIKGLLYDERLTLEGAKKRLLAEARARNRQLTLDMRKGDTAAVLRRVRERLETVRRLLAP
jgi:hypothetical protein